MKKFSHTSNIVHGTPWMIERRALATVAAIFQRHLDGEAIPQVATAGEDGGIVRRVGDWSVIQVHGTILPRADMMSNMSGGVGCTQIIDALGSSLESDAKSIALDFDSCGGSVAKIFETVGAIKEARQYKPVFASVSGLCCSAAYLLASQCESIVATSDSVIGSVGVICSLDNFDRAEKNAGNDPITVASSRRKAMSGMSEDEIREEMRGEVDMYFGMMRDAINSNRPGLIKDAESFPGTLLATAAVEAGLIDEIGSLAQMVQEKILS